jgi:hypothetical protein
MEGTEEQKRLVRRLIGGGRGLAEAWGFRVNNNPGNLFQLLYLSILLKPRGDYQRAVNTALALRDRGWDSPARMANALQADRFRVVRDVSHRRDSQEVAAILGDLGRVIGARYRGDLRRLRTEARQDPAKLRALLTALPGVDDEVVDLFFREVQAVWPEVGPFADRRALTAARRLGLGRSLPDLAALIGRREGERFAWLVGALARVELEKRYGEFSQPARA